VTKDGTSVTFYQDCQTLLISFYSSNDLVDPDAHCNIFLGWIVFDFQKLWTLILLLLVIHLLVTIKVVVSVGL
jgi:hypothetical protein